MKSLLWIALLMAQDAPQTAQTPPVSAPNTAPSVTVPVAPATAPPIASPRDPLFTACMDTLRVSAGKRGISTADFDRFTATLAPDMSVLDLLDAQPEFTTPLWDYLSGLVDEERVQDGRAQLTTYQALLNTVAAQSGVDAATIVAVWGVESDYGRVFGKRPLLTSLSTLSCFGRRQAFFRGELLSLLSLLQAGDLRAEGLTGSWAGAFGHTQFMPSTYQRIAVDQDGDGRRDLVASIPDALGSTANYLARAGWQSGQPWGYEVKIPPGLDASLAGRTQRRPLSDWSARGITRIDGTPLPPGDTPSALLLPTGAQGPAFVVFRNYDAIYAYNAAESYALAIALLSDRLRGGGGLVTPWPTPDPGLSRAQRRQLQTLLLARGYAIGAADGMIGTQTRRAIQAEQIRLGLQPVDGRAGMTILTALSAAPPPVPAPVPTPPSSTASPP